MKKIYAVLFLCIISTAGLKAQQTNGLATFVRSGLYTLSSSSSSLNKIAPAGFDLLHASFATVGAEGYYRDNRLLLILDGNIGLENSKIITSQSVKLYTETFFVKTGWIVKRKEALLDISFLWSGNNLT
jgi:hypothetical protein